MTKTDISLGHMRIFVAVGETRTYTEAAAALGMPISKVSRAIKATEAASRLQLIRRLEGSVHLTQAGLAYLAACRSVLAAVQTSSDVLQSQRSEVEGLLRVGVPPVFARSVLLPLIPRFKRQYPKLRLEFVLYTSRWDRLPGAKHDLLIKLKLPGESSREARFHLKLFPPIRQALFASPAYLASRGPVISLDSLRDHHCIGYSSTGELNAWTGHRIGEPTQVHPSFDFIVSDAEMQLLMAQNGLGIALLPLWLVQASVVSGRLVRVLPDFEGDPILFNVLHSGKSRITAKERAFLTFLDHIIASELDPRVQGQAPSAFFQLKS